ncbi:MAG TPA: hypothetical protein DIW64_16155 [Cellvibrio sp.]|nr:hypothetical protein [Cellvibrio sp.]
MGFFDKKTTKNTTTNDYAYDQSTTFVDNTVDNSDRSFTDNSDRSFTDNANNSMNLSQSDNSDNSFTDYSDRSFADYSDQSFRVDQKDSSDNSMRFADSSTKTSTLSDYSDNSFSASLTDLTKASNSGNTSVSNSTSSSTSNNTNITDGGAFAVVNNLVSKVFDNNKTLIDLVGLNSKTALQGANDLASSGLSAAMNIKAGEQVSVSNAESKNALLETVLKIAAVGGLSYVAIKAMK